MAYAAPRRRPRFPRSESHARPTSLSSGAATADGPGSIRAIAHNCKSLKELDVWYASPRRRPPSRAPNLTRASDPLVRYCSKLTTLPKELCDIPTLEEIRHLRLQHRRPARGHRRPRRRRDAPLLRRAPGGVGRVRHAQGRAMGPGEAGKTSLLRRLRDADGAVLPTKERPHHRPRDDRGLPRPGENDPKLKLLMCARHGAGGAHASLSRARARASRRRAPSPLSLTPSRASPSRTSGAPSPQPFPPQLRLWRPARVLPVPPALRSRPARSASSSSTSRATSTTASMPSSSSSTSSR